jgi:hypothetical protein
LSSRPSLLGSITRLFRRAFDLEEWPHQLHALQGNLVTTSSTLGKTTTSMGPCSLDGTLLRAR